MAHLVIRGRDHLHILVIRGRVHPAKRRKWLGGLKSFHSVYGEPHNEDGKVYIGQGHADSGKLDQNYKLRGEKEL